jgi:hypothetical protein
MKASELSYDTKDQLKNGTVFTAENGCRAVIGDTDVVAFEDTDGGWQVASSVRWENVEDLSADDLLGHRLTAADFATGINGDLLYIGPLAPAQNFIKKEHTVSRIDRDIKTGLYRVELDEGNVFGVADTPEMAWRYALAAELGPIDEEFHEFHLK